MSKTKITAGARVIEVNGGRDPISADVTKVSKDGKRMLIKFWGRGLRDGKLTSQWVDASGWRPTGGLAAVLAPLIGGAM